MSSNILTLYSKIKYRCSPRRGSDDVRVLANRGVTEQVFL